MVLAAAALLLVSGWTVLLTFTAHAAWRAGEKMVAAAAVLLLVVSVLFTVTVLLRGVGL